MSQQPLPAPSAVLQDPLIKEVPRACEACRMRKIKCKPPLSSSTRICECCATSNRECIFIVRSNKRRRRRTDARVTELEKQIEALGALVNQRNPHASSDRPGIPEDDEEPTGQLDVLMQVDQSPDHNRLPTQNNGLLGIHQAPNSSSCSSTSAPVGASPRDPYENPTEDVIDRGLLSIEDASRLLVRYTHELVPHFPIVPLPEGVTLPEMRRQKPVLLLSVLAAAAGTSHADQNLQLNLEIQQTYAKLVIVKGEKSLELLQSILITTTWLCPPDRFDQLKFYQYLHMAWSMALDIELDKRSRPSAFVTQDDLTMGSKSPESRHVEDRRTLLSCYIMCSMVSVALRRQSMVRFSTMMAESVDLLETSSYSYPTDRRLCAWVRLQRIMEQYSTAISWDDSASIGSLAEPRVQYTINGFHRQIKDWKESLGPGVLNQSLLIFYHVNTVYIHELAMYVDHDPGDFKPPFVVKSVVRSEGRGNLPPMYIDALSTVQSSTQALLDAFLLLNADGLRALPIVNYVRVTYGIVVLTKLSLSAMAAENPLGQLLDARNIQAAAYQDSLVTHLARAVGSNQFRVASKFFMIILKLRSWYVRYAVPVSQTVKEEEQIEPCVYLGPEHDPYANNDQLPHSSQGENNFLYSLTDGSLPAQDTSMSDEGPLPIGVNLSLAEMSGLMSDSTFDGLLDLGTDFDFDFGSWPM
ncbi:MAG: hypothetical protein L6R38_007830 [Xanthoria sp. 2 TBL-2021]|nr:MAG: hypothetical protein L6R38_007830 [Xanthoria sp. 2 TBL-2021]